MPKVSAVVIDRMRTLIEKGLPLTPSAKHGFAMTYDEDQQTAGWVTSASHCIEAVVPSVGSAYRSNTRMAVASFLTASADPGRVGTIKSESIRDLVSILQSLLEDIDAGMLTTVEDRIRGEVFDDFLDQAEGMIRSGRIEAGVLAGVVFEDTIRQIGRKHGADREKVDDIISELVKANVISPTKAKAARLAADVRTRATHAEWDAFDLADVKAAVEITRSLILQFLS